MNASSILFYIVGLMVITFAILTVFTRKIFRAAIYLLLSLICIAGLYILMDMQFIAALQIIIYVGGIVVLIIFSIFLTAQAGERLPKQKTYRIVLGFVMTAAGFVFTLWILANHVFTKALETPLVPSVQNIGLQLLSYHAYGYVFPFEAVSILLLAALIGSVVIAIKEKNK